MYPDSDFAAGYISQVTSAFSRNSRKLDAKCI
jgi:hypothetical protein